MKLRTKRINISAGEAYQIIKEDKDRIFLRIDNYHKSDAEVRIAGKETDLDEKSATLHPGDYIHLHGDESNIDIWCWADHDTQMNIMEVLK